MVALLQRDDLGMRSEMDVIKALEPWRASHSDAELVKLLPSLRLAWIPGAELCQLLTTDLLSGVKDNATVQQLVEAALEAQERCGKKRGREVDEADEEEALV